MDQLSVFLGHCYDSDVLGKGNRSESLKVLKDKLAKGSALEREARERLPNLEKTKDRCFINKKHLQYLQSALTN